jgi:hypothetical protein
MHKVDLWSAICYRCFPRDHDLGIYGVSGKLVDDMCGQYANQNKHKARTLGGPGAIIFENEKSQHKVQKRKMYIHGAVYKNYGIFGAIWFDKTRPSED